MNLKTKDIMTSNQLVQMALSAILRCKEKLDLFDLINVLRGRSTKSLKEKGYNTIKTFGSGSVYSRKQWCYWIIQMIQQSIILVDYADDYYLKVSEKGRKVLNGELEITLEGATNETFKLTRNGVTICFDSDVYGSIKWREYISDLNKIVYWNYKEERRININEIIPEGVKEREKVKEKYLEIAKLFFNLVCEDEIVVIPKKVDRDIYGNEVTTLSLPFEECLAKLEQFVKTTGRYPQMNALADEVALRKWYREVGHGLIPITSAQKSAFLRFTAQYPMSKKMVKS